MSAGTIHAALNQGVELSTTLIAPAQHLASLGLSVDDLAAS